MTHYSTVITGASSGIGHALSRQFARRGHHLLLIARNSTRLQRLQQDLHNEFGVTVDITCTDLANRTQLHALCNQLRSTNVDILVNNAGIATAEDFTTATTARQDQILDVNYRASNELTRAVLPQMVARRCGGIINIASLSGVIHGDPDIGYAASKAALIALTKSLVVQYRHHGVIATVALPGFVRTEIHSRAGLSTVTVPRLLWGTPEKVADSIIQAHLKRRVEVVVPRIYRPIHFLYRILPVCVTRTLVRSFHQRATPLTKQGESCHLK